jgi:flagellar biosynthetic protein FlhB
MSDQGSEQNKSEEATPFKLRRAREKGQVARGMDLGFFGGLSALAAFLIISGEELVHMLSQLMRKSLTVGIDSAADPQGARAFVGALYWPALQPILLLGGTVLILVTFLEILQLRGLVFSSHPLKPDFSRVNPAKGLKRLFSMRMLKEALKSIVKMAAYTTLALFAVRSVLADPGRAGTDAHGLATAMESSGMRLLFLFILLALFFAAIDQILVRKEFTKQMRMSRREVTREAKEREGEPRMKQKRKQLHAEFVKQSKGLGNLPGSDLLVVNPEHFAVALVYDATRMSAPQVSAKGRNHHALMLKQRAFRLGIPIYENPPLARALYRQCEPGAPVGSDHYRAVADLYLKLHRSKAATQAKNDDVQQDTQQE